jgi:hypothetical protein
VASFASKESGMTRAEERVDIGSLLRPFKINYRGYAQSPSHATYLV